MNKIYIFSFFSLLAASINHFRCLKIDIINDEYAYFGVPNPKPVLLVVTAWVPNENAIFL